MSLNHSPISLVRSLKGAPLACLFILLIEGQARRAGALCQATAYSPNSITAALRLLADLHLVEKTPDGWRIPAGLRDALLSQHGNPAPFANRDAPASNRDSYPSGGEDSSSSMIDQPPPPLGQPSQFAQWQSNAQILGISTDNSQLNPRFLGAAAGNLPSRLAIARILDATQLLFGERLHGPPSRYPDVRLLLATLAEAYSRRRSLRKPARVAYANLKRGVDPGSEFLADPLIYLPGNFLLAAGLPFDPQSGESLAGEALSGEENPLEDPLPVLHPSLSLPADAQSRRTALQVWEIALEALRVDLPHHLFQSRLEACELAAFDPLESVFTLAAPDEQACLWLKDRLSARIAHLLTGICDRPSRVRFEVLP